MELIRLRVYGHEFLAQRCLVQLSLGHPFSRLPGNKIPPVKLYSRSGQDPLHLWSSLKLVMTSKSDISAVPHSVILPLPDEREVFSFQVQSLERFTLELSLYPTFGSKVIGRAIILPSTFQDIRYHKGFIAPLLDHHLKTIGEVAFEVSCIRPFQGAQLEIGGRVETYWKSKVTPTTGTQDHAHQYQAHRPLTVSSTATPTQRPAAIAPAAPPRESALVTASSLSGEYVNVVVQVTKDGVPVVYPHWRLPVGGLDISVSDVTYDQFAALAESNHRAFVPPAGSAAVEWYTSIAQSLTSLEQLLSVVPSDLGLNVQLRYNRGIDRSSTTTRGAGKTIEVNAFVDTVLHTIYAAAKNHARTDAAAGGRKMVFSSFDPTVCTALNWKQPNCTCPLYPSHSLTPRRRLLCILLRPRARSHAPRARPRAAGRGARYAVPERARSGQLCEKHESAGRDYRGHDAGGCAESCGVGQRCGIVVGGVWGSGGRGGVESGRGGWAHGGCVLD